MIISIGFRVNSKKTIKFRTWANRIIKDYMVQGFALNDERFLKEKKSDQEYFKINFIMQLLEILLLKQFIKEWILKKKIWDLLPGKIHPMGKF